MTLFNFKRLAIDKPIRLIELFGGIGSQAMALRDIGADFTRHRLVEFDAAAGVCGNRRKLWAMAGNSIALPVLKAFFSQMLSPP